MTEETNRDKKQCVKKGKVMLAYGLIQLSSSVISALALASIAFSFYIFKEEAKVFKECVEEVKANGKNLSTAVRFCNGSK